MKKQTSPNEPSRTTRSKNKRVHEVIDYSLFDEDYDCLSEKEEQKKSKAAYLIVL